MKKLLFVALVIASSLVACGNDYRSPCPWWADMGKKCYLAEPTSFTPDTRIFLENWEVGIFQFHNAKVVVESGKATFTDLETGKEILPDRIESGKFYVIRKNGNEQVVIHITRIEDNPLSPSCHMQLARPNP